MPRRRPQVTVNKKDMCNATITARTKQQFQRIDAANPLNHPLLTLRTDFDDRRISISYYHLALPSPGNPKIRRGCARHDCAMMGTILLAGLFMNYPGQDEVFE
jgi:hypothetical protein